MIDLVKGLPVIVAPNGTHWGEIAKVENGFIITPTHTIDYIDWALIIDNNERHRRVEIRQ